MCIIKLIHKGVSALKKIYFLLNHEMRGMYKTVTAVCLSLIVLQQVLIIKSLDYYPNRFERFELLFAKSGAVMVFLVCLFILCGLCIYNVYSNYIESKSVYTLFTFPIPREYVFFSKLITHAVCFLILVASQIISAAAGYGIYCFYNSSLHINGLTAKANNGLFLAFIRSDFFRILLPFGLKSLLSSAALFINLVCTLYYAVICERSRRYFRFAIVILNLSLIIYSLIYRMNILTASGFYINVLSVVLFLTAIFAVYDSLRLIKKSAVV